jgi:hypothetical protein
MSSDRSKSKWTGIARSNEQKVGDKSALEQKNTKSSVPDADKVITCANCVSEHHSKNNDSDREITGQISKWTRNIGWFTAALVLVTGGLVYVGVRADETARASQRAFVGVKDVKITAIGPETGKDSATDFLYRIDTECENSGDTQTRNLTIDSSLTIPYMPSMRLEWKPQDARKLVILPKQVTNCSFNTVIDAHSLNSMKGKGTIAIMGSARYDDVYYNPHVTLFCLILEPAPIDYTSGVATGLSVAQCPKYNCADDDCAEYKTETGLSKLLDYLK